jgi:hypothetical protein
MSSVIWRKTALILHGLVATNISLSNGVGKLPPMGYNGISGSFRMGFCILSRLRRSLECIPMQRGRGSYSADCAANERPWAPSGWV